MKIFQEERDVLCCQELEILLALNEQQTATLKKVMLKYYGAKK